MTIRATAAVLKKPRDLQLRDFTVPDIGPDEGLLRVEACGLCGTDYEQWPHGMTGSTATRSPSATFQRFAALLPTASMKPITS